MRGTRMRGVGNYAHAEARTRGAALTRRSGAFGARESQGEPAGAVGARTFDVYGQRVGSRTTIRDALRKVVGLVLHDERRVRERRRLELGLSLAGWDGCVDKRVARGVEPQMFVAALASVDDRAAGPDEHSTGGRGPHLKRRPRAVACFPAAGEPFDPYDGVLSSGREGAERQGANGAEGPEHRHGVGCHDKKLLFHAEPRSETMRLRRLTVENSTGRGRPRIPAKAYSSVPPRLRVKFKSHIKPRSQEQSKGPETRTLAPDPSLPTHKLASLRIHDLLNLPPQIRQMRSRVRIARFTLGGGELSVQRTNLLPQHRLRVRQAA